MKIMVNDQLINYSDEGEGEVLLLLHGWGSSLHTFDQLTKELVKKYRVVRLDFPGFGDSPQPADDWSIGDYADMVTDFLKKRGIDKLHASIIHSFGGRVLIKALGQHMIVTDRVVLIGSGGIKHSNSLRQQGFRVIAKTGKQVMRLPGLHRFKDKLRGHLYESAGANDYLQAGAMRQIFLNAINEDLRELAANIEQPTLLIWGEHDEESPLADAEIFHNEIKNSELVIIADAGHFVHTEQPRKVIDRIEVFLK